MPVRNRRPGMRNRMRWYGPMMMGMGGWCPTCGGTGMRHRRYFSEEEERECLQDYLSDLEAEARAVRRQIEELGGDATT